MKRNGMLCAFAALLLPAIALSQQPAQFKTTLNAGGTITDGNSKTRQANAALVTEGEKEGLGAVRAGVEANYGESTVGGKKDTTVNNARIFGGARKTLSKMTFASADVSALYDDVAKVDYRAMLGLGLGVYLVKNERTSLSVEAGPAYVWEKVSGVTDDYLALRFAERATHAISNTAKVWQSAEYLPKADDFGDYLLNAELGAEAAMNARMSLRLVLQDKYDSTPGEGLKKNDLTLIAGVGVKL